jgi:hypothetical protein
MLPSALVALPLQASKTKITSYKEERKIKRKRRGQPLRISPSSLQTSIGEHLSATQREKRLREREKGTATVSVSAVTAKKI